VNLTTQVCACDGTLIWEANGEDFTPQVVKQAAVGLVTPYDVHLNPLSWAITGLIRQSARNH